MFTIPSVSPVYEGQPAFSVGKLDSTRSLVDLVTHHTWLDYYSSNDYDADTMTKDTLIGMFEEGRM